MKGSEAQKHRPHELLWMLCFDEKSKSRVSICPPPFTPFSATPVYYQVKTRSFWFRQEAPKLFISFRQKKEPSYDALNEKVIFRS